MKKYLLVYALFFICLTSAYSAQKVSPPPPIAANSQSKKIAEKPDDELQKQIGQIAAAAKGRVGVKAVLLETGETAALKSNERFPMQSVFKLPISMAILRQVDQGKIKLEQKVRVEKSDFVRQGMYSPIRDENPNGTELTVSELIKFAVSESDGTASDVLFDLAGGAGAMSKYLGEIGVSEMIVANSEKEIGQDWETQYENYATPEAAVKLLGVLHEQRGISEQSRALLLKFLIESGRGQKRLKGLLPADTIVAHKTGTSGSRNAVTAATNDIGIITLPNGNHLLIAVFVSDSPMDEKTREETIAKIAHTVWDKWSRSR